MPVELVRRRRRAIESGRSISADDISQSAPGRYIVCGGTGEYSVTGGSPARVHPKCTCADCAKGRAQLCRHAAVGYGGRSAFWMHLCRAFAPVTLYFPVRDRLRERGREREYYT